MRNQLPTKNSNRNPKINGKSTAEKNNKKRKKDSNQFEFCQVCKLNHDQGRRHNFFPNHIKSLSSFLSRFQSKLSEVVFFLKNPSRRRPEHAYRNRLWCVFCDSDIDEINSSFACGNAINHLASVNHLKSLQSFLWKYGGTMDCLDSFRISEVDLDKWEKKCKLLKNESANEEARGLVTAPLNDIHNELNSNNIANFDKNNIPYLNSCFSNGVVPLQKHTNERYQVSHSELSKVSEVGPLFCGDNSDMCPGTQFDKNSWGPKDFTGYTNSQHFIVPNGRNNSYLRNGGLKQVLRDERATNGEGSSQGLQKLTQISSLVREEAKGNVHSGGPPPWFNSNEGKQFDEKLKPGKSSKLNPKRVGAAWAERRKVELELEKRGEHVTTNFDANWLPNFGRVWQSGSRKESRKEFEGATSTSHKVESHAEKPIQLQPYISKRLRRS